MGEVLKAENLIRTSQEWAHRALAAYQNNDNATAIALAGISWEHLCKACLCSVSPVLVTALTSDNRRNWQVLTQIMGLDVQRSGRPAQTIDPAEAQARVRELHDLQFDHKPLQKLIDARNNVLHSGLLPECDPNLVIAEFLRASNEILQRISVNRSDQWGEYESFVAQLLTENLREIDAHVKRKLARARAKLAELRENVPGEMWEEFTHARQTRTSDETALLFDRPLGLKGAVKLPSGATLTVGPRFDPSTSIVRDECPVCGGEQGAFLGHLTQTRVKIPGPSEANGSGVDCAN